MKNFFNIPAHVALHMMQVEARRQLKLLRSQIGPGERTVLTLHKRIPHQAPTLDNGAWQRAEIIRQSNKPRSRYRLKRLRALGAITQEQFKSAT